MADALRSGRMDNLLVIAALPGACGVPDGSFCAMIIIHEIRTVVILVPRTGSSTLRRAIAERYPDSMMIYRHMEADGLPLGYDRYRKVGVARNPMYRLWSLYKFLQNFGSTGNHEEKYAARMRESVAMSFSEWIINNEVPFTTPYDSAGYGRYWPQYTVRHPLPENRKSQEVYLRPDLGTEVFKYTDMYKLYLSLGLIYDHTVRHNATSEYRMLPTVSTPALEHINRFFQWDFEVTARGA